MTGADLDAPITADEALAAVAAFHGEIDANAARALAAEVLRLRGILADNAPRCATCGDVADLICQRHGWTEAQR